MQQIILEPNDERIGKPGKRPKVDVFGNPVNLKPNDPIMSRAMLGNGQYVILPMGMKDPVQVTIGTAKTATRAKDSGDAN